MDKQMTPQEIAEMLKNDDRFTNVAYSPRFNTVSVYYNEMADTAEQVEAILSELGFNEPGRGFARLDSNRVGQQELPTREEAMNRLRTVVGAQYLFKNE